MSADFAFTFRILNFFLSGMVAGLCFLKMSFRMTKIDIARNTRVIGLGILCLAIAWISYDFRHYAFSPRILLITIGLLFCLYGMRRPASGERGRNKVL